MRPVLRWLAVGAVLAAGAGCSEDRPAPEEISERVEAKAQRALEQGVSQADQAHGKTLVAKFECQRCHEVPGIEPPELGSACAGCHQKILQGGVESDPERLAQYQANIKSFAMVPALASTDRFRRDWVAAYLESPHDVRPNLPESMPRLAIGTAEAAAIAAFLVPSPEAETNVAGGDLKRGRAIMERTGCASCHRFSGAPTIAAAPVPIDLNAKAMSDGQRFAPDLRYTRERMRPAALVAWLEDPLAVKPDSRMPKIPLTRDEVRDVAAFLLESDLEPVAPAPIPERLPVLEREVTFQEVYDEVIHHTCRHCHADPDKIVANGGPGYSGGLGLPKRALDLSSYEGVIAGSIADDGTRHSVLATSSGGSSVLVARLLARQAEVAGRPIDGVRGMPLGLPPLSPEQIQLVETWIATGRKR